MTTAASQPLNTKTHTAREAIAQDLGIPIEEIRPEARILQDLGLDIFDVQELLEALEDEFDVALPRGAEDLLRTVADIESVVREARAAPLPGGLPRGPCPEPAESVAQH